MNATDQDIHRFVEYACLLSGDEKGEAQVFCDRLFRAFGHLGYKEAGATLEQRVKAKGKATRFADLVWSPRLLLEMKRRGEKLQNHVQQTLDYWIRLVPQRPKHVVLCNFDEFWIYDFNTQVDEPVDRVAMQDLPQRHTAFNFLFPEDKAPVFNNNRVAVTRAAADRVAEVFNTMVKRGEERDRAQRFILQCVVAMFSEDVHLLPSDLFTELVAECRSKGQSAYDLIGGLFRQMNAPQPARGGRYVKVPYFNGGVFHKVEPVELTGDELTLLDQAAREDWSKVQPAIFGTLFQSSMDKKERHAYGAHFTSEADILKVVLPTIVRPWRERIEVADKLNELSALRQELLHYRVLDPACGSGDFLYVAYREMKRIEMELLAKIHANFGERARAQAGTTSMVSTTQFFGIDNNSFAVELAKVTLMLGKELAVAETQNIIKAEQIDLPLEWDTALPLDNLDANIRQDDALFCAWPKADAIIGNPPYQSKNKMQQEYGAAYAARVRARYPKVPGRADYCVYWFRRAHDELAPGARAGLVGTNTIRQNESREGGLDYIVGNGGTITEAVSTQPWSGDAAVSVSIVNWIKGEQSGPKFLYRQLGDRFDSDSDKVALSHIHAALSGSLDVTQAKRLRANMDSGACYQGQTHGHEGFLLSPDEAATLRKAASRNAEAIFPYFIADELIGKKPPLPQRYAIDFHPRDVITASTYAGPFQRIREKVLPDREEAARKEEERNREVLEENDEARVNLHHRNFLKKWWRFSYPREELISRITKLPRYIACGRVTKRPIFEFIANDIRPNDALQVFPLADDYSFGVLQSNLHWLWFTERCSTLTDRFRYTSDTVFDAFPWPQTPDLAQATRVAEKAVTLRALRRRLMDAHNLSLRELYRTLELPGHNPLKDAQDALDAAVRTAYGMGASEDPLYFLLKLNSTLAEREATNQPVAGPGLPSLVRGSTSFVTDDCIRMPA